MRSSRLLAIVALGLVLAACTRARTHPSPVATLPDSPPPIPAASAFAVALPIEGEAIASPVLVEGNVPAESGRALAAVVYERTSDGQLAWRGNAPLVVDGARFSGAVTYTLDADAPGVVEVVVIDPVTGTVVDRRSVAVALRLAR